MAQNRGTKSTILPRGEVDQEKAKRRKERQQQQQREREDDFFALLSRLGAEHDVRDVKREVMFAKSLGRRWRFDFALPDLWLAVEIDGGGWVHGRHNRALGARKDMEKLNTANNLGWLVYRFDWETAFDGTAEKVLRDGIRRLLVRDASGKRRSERAVQRRARRDSCVEDRPAV